MRSILALAGFLALSFAVAALAGAGSVGSASTYLALQRPTWAPPAGAFGPVWAVLYTLLAIAAWLVWRERSADRAPALTLFAVQFVPNVLWSWLFFRLGLVAWALADIVTLAILVGLTIGAFWRVRPLAGALLLPYLAWVLFAGVLNWAILGLNGARI